jgi:hypothetical protein
MAGGKEMNKMMGGPLDFAPLIPGRFYQNAEKM